MNYNYYEQLFSVMRSSADLGALHLTTDEQGFSANTVHFNGKEFKNFSLCDYLALSTDSRLKEGAINAIQKHGVYTAVSKSYIKLDIYAEAEELLGKVFKKPSILFARTTLAHLGVMPVIINTTDAVIIDHQAHTSIRMATEILKSNGIYIETIRHNRTDLLEEKIKELKSKYSRIWYLADSVYSMYGDVLPFNDLNRLLNEYEQFHLYVDDAHGMSWMGENGCGYLLNHMPYHERMVLITSLGKGFGAGGGAVICYNQEIKKLLETCAPPLLFSLPLSPGNLGAIIESAKIHLSNEIVSRQSELRQRVSLFYNTAKALELPILNNPVTPIAFIPTGKTDMCQEVCLNLMAKSLFANVSHFPAVPLYNSGIRVAISLNHSHEDIIELLSAFKEEYQKALDKRSLTVNDILKHYKVEKTENVTAN